MLSQLESDEVALSPWDWELHPEVWVLVAFLTGAYIYAVRIIGPKAVPDGVEPVSKKNKWAFGFAMATLWIASDWPMHDISEEYLYSAMEDYKIDIVIDTGPNARTVQIALENFTLIGATTRSGLLTAPLRARFGINSRLEYYDTKTLTDIVERSAGLLKIPIKYDAAFEIASRSRGTPRIAKT